MIKLLLVFRANQNPIIFLIILLIIVIAFYFTRRARVIRALKNTGLKRIRDFQDNDQGKITGTVVFAGDTIYAPFSKRKCVYYHVIVEEYSRRGKSKNWHTIIEEERKGDIVMNDGTGYAIIDSNDALTYLVPDAHYNSNGIEKLTDTLEEFLSRHNVEGRGFFGFHKTLRYSEGILEKGEVFTVSGEGQWNLAKDHKLNLPTAKVLVIIPGKAERVVLTDDTDAIDPENFN